MHWGGTLSLYMAFATAITVFVVAVAYNQVISFHQARNHLLGPHAGLVSGSVPIVDYMLTIAISVASGVDAVFSLLPVGASSYKLSTESHPGLLAVFPEPARRARIDKGMLGASWPRLISPP